MHGWTRENIRRDKRLEMKSFLRLKLKGRNFMGIGIMKSCQDKFGNLLSCNALVGHAGWERGFGPGDRPILPNRKIPFILLIPNALDVMPQSESGDRGRGLDSLKKNWSRRPLLSVV